MYGFDKRKAWWAGLRYGLRFIVPLTGCLLVMGLNEDGRGPAPDHLSMAVATLLIFGVLPGLSMTYSFVAQARAMHLYGRPLHAELSRKVPLLTWFLGYARVTLGGEGEGPVERRWCYGVPWQISKLPVGAEVEVLLDSRPEKKRKSCWLPFWAPAGAAEVDVQELGHEIMGGLADVLRPLEGELEGMERKVAVQGRLAGCGTFFAVIAALALLTTSGLALLGGFAAMATAIAVVYAAQGGSRRRAVRAARERFDEQFPEGTPERQAALMILGQEKAATPAWKALRKALKA